MIISNTLCQVHGCRVACLLTRLQDHNQRQDRHRADLGDPCRPGGPCVARPQPPHYRDSSVPLRSQQCHVETVSDTFCCFDKEQYSFSGFHISFFITSFAFPTTLILILYIVMLVSLWGCSTFRHSK